MITNYGIETARSVIRLRLTCKLHFGDNLWGHQEQYKHLQLCCWKFKTNNNTKKLCNRLNPNELKILFTKTTNLVSEPPFEGVRGNVRTSYIARLTARGRLVIRDN